MRGSAWDDWPIGGPRTVMWVASYIAEHYSTPGQRHSRFVQEGRLHQTDTGVAAHSVFMKILQYAACCDQVDLPQLARAELSVEPSSSS